MVAGLKTQRVPHRTAATNYSTCEALSHSYLLTIMVTIRSATVHNSLQKGKLPLLILSHINTVHALPQDLNKNHFNNIPHLGASLSPSFPCMHLFTKRATSPTHFVLLDTITRMKLVRSMTMKQLVVLFLPASIPCKFFSDTNISISLPFSNTLRSVPPLQHF